MKSMDPLACQALHDDAGAHECMFVTPAMLSDIPNSVSPDGGSPWVSVVSVSACENQPERGLSSPLPVAGAGEACSLESIAASSPDQREAATALAPAVLIALDPSGKILLASGPGYSTLGLDPGAIIGLRAQEVFSREPDVLAVIDRALQGKKLVAEANCGDAVWGCRFKPVRAESGELIGVIGAAYDVTGSETVAGAFHDSEARLRAIAHVASIVLYALNSDGIIILVEGKGLTSLGLKPHEIVGKSIFDLCRNRPELLRAATHAAKGQAFSEVLELHNLAFHIHNSAVVSAQGEMLGSIGVAVDITLHPRIAETLLWKEANYLELVDSLQDGIWRLDSNWETTFVNRRMGDMLGVRPGALIGRSLFEFLDQDFDAAALRECMQLGAARISLAELRFVRRDGKELLTRVSAAPAFSEAGESSGILLTVSDITRCKRVEAELKRRDAELAHAARLNTMGEFMAGITHEIHQPLHAIATFASACQKCLESEASLNLAELTHWTSQISRQAHRIAAIIGRLGRFFRRSGEPVTAPFDLNVLIREMMEMLGAEFRRQRIRLELDLGQDIPQIEGDDVQIAQIVVNLVRNAIDSMADVPAPMRRLGLRTTFVEPDSIELAVQDAGPGFSPDRIEPLFEPFYTTKPNGMGMGLAICRSIAEAHHGELTAASLPGQGATFRLQLPIKQLSSSP